MGKAPRRRLRLAPRAAPDRPRAPCRAGWARARAHPLESLSASQAGARDRGPVSSRGAGYAAGLVHVDDCSTLACNAWRPPSLPPRSPRRKAGRRTA
ncbi:hypothetical protein GUJ93_ZPchr0003g17037 [Zizania palustris]|uniref:Uncharacterized protein n=1 Tax=Zizania palustris TaxID=103762 RepID=A0A8J5VXM0_ZIZPA|nr:hypothetical protein GUJ93_ZPchr0003g17037 [Zizania palustris]